MTLFDYLNPPDEILLYQHHDPDDIRLGEVVHVNQDTYPSANVVIIGCPQDVGVQRNRGRVGSAQAPDEIRRALYRLVVPDNPDLVCFDIGNTKIQPTLEETHSVQSDIIRQMILDGKRIVSLGGGNDLSYADCMGLAQAISDVLAINVDAHFDVRTHKLRNSGTPYRQLLEEGYIQPEKFFEVANTPMVNSAIHRDYLLGKRSHIIDLNTVQAQGIASIFDNILSHTANALFWGLDMDVVRVADAPGVSALNSLGITAHDFCQIASIAGCDPRSKVFEITEVNPVYDIDSRTAKLAAAAIHHFLANLDF